MKRLLYITTNINNSGGVSKLLSVKLNYLVSKLGYDIHVLNTFGSTSTPFYNFDRAIKFHHLERSFLTISDIVRYKRRLNHFIDKINPDIIVNSDNGLKGSLFPFYYKGKTPIFFENHNSKNVKAKNLFGNLKIKLQNALFLLFIEKYTQVIVYDYAKDDWKSRNIKIISNPLSFKIPKKSSSLENKVVIAVGRISYQKGYDMLLQIWRIVNKKYPDWQLLIYGEGDVKKYLKIAQEYTICNSISFMNPVKDIKEVYLNATMLLNTSRYEPFGLAIIEAMACGLPVIAFENTLGPKSYITNNENSFLIEKSNLNDYANTIMLLIENKGEAKRISVNAKESMKKYDLNTIMKLWHHLFQSFK